MDANYLEYSAAANSDSGCTTVKVEGCMDAHYVEHNTSANSHVPSACETLLNADHIDHTNCAALLAGADITCSKGCMDTNYDNFDASVEFQSHKHLCQGFNITKHLSCADLKGAYGEQSCC